MPNNEIQLQQGLSLIQFMDIYGTDEKCGQALFNVRWPAGFQCPKCRKRSYRQIKNIHLFICNQCQHESSLTKGTIFHESELSLRSWFLAIHLLTQSEDDIASSTLAQHLGVSHEEAWKVKYRLTRFMLDRDKDTPFKGQIELDAAFWSSLITPMQNAESEQESIIPIPDEPLPSQATVLIEDLTNSNLFHGVSNHILEQVSNRAAAFELKKGEVLLTPHRENRRLYLLLSGELSIHFESLDTPPIRNIQAGFTVGELSIILDSWPSAFVVANKNCRVLSLDRKLTWWMVKESKALCRNMLTLLARWVLINTSRIINDRNQIDELAAHALTDGLTTLFNRRWLDKTFPRLLDRAKSGSQTICIIMLDVDHFKKYNDTQGHLAGDQALKTLGSVMKSQIRPQDYAVRYGGEEFIIIMPQTTLEESIIIAERLRSSIEKQEIFLPNEQQIPSITISAGIAMSTPECSAESLIKKADTLLYQSKKSGRNRFHYPKKHH
ncbi:MAG: diguanylate cyclase [Magnetococcales bacterium]|nr:diguanylate cyclase [Magnetococcales bacterium]